MVREARVPSDSLFLFSAKGRVKCIWLPRNEKRAIRLLKRTNAWACFDSDFWVVGVIDGKLTRMEDRPDPLFFSECWHYNICWSRYPLFLGVDRFALFSEIYPLPALIEHSAPAIFDQNRMDDWPRAGRTGIVVYPDHYFVFFLVASRENGWVSEEWTDGVPRGDHLEDESDPTSWAGSPEIRYFDDQYDRIVERTLWGVRDFARVGGKGEVLTQMDFYRHAPGKEEG